MQTLRLLPAVAVIALCASTFSTRADDTPAQAAARAILMQDANDTGNTETTTPPPATPVPPPPPATPPMPAPAAAETNTPATTTASGSMWPSPNTNNPAAQTTANAALPEQMNGTNGPSATPMPPSPPPVPEQPVTAPPLPISDSQQQQLQALLQQYVSNQITPAQYQAGRAKILAGQ